MEPRDRPQAIREALYRHLGATHVEVIDDSSAHLGHPGADLGGGHFRVVVVSARFEGLSRLGAQRLVYDALGSLMDRDIHALQIRTLTPVQWPAT